MIRQSGDIEMNTDRYVVEDDNDVTYRLIPVQTDEGATPEKPNFAIINTEGTNKNEK